MSVSPSHECDNVSEDLTEFALGLLTGRERSRVLGHVTSCLHCRGELNSLALVSDRLLNLAPPGEPSVGFETRLVQRWRQEAVRTPRRRPGLVALVAAAVILVGGALVTITPHSSTTVATSAHYGETLASAPFTAQGKIRGQLWVTQGDPTWVFMSLNNVNVSRRARCRVTLRNGQVRNLGVFSLVGGSGSWAAHVNASGESIQFAQITDAAGHVLASATLTSRKE